MTVNHFSALFNVWSKGADVYLCTYTKPASQAHRLIFSSAHCRTQTWQRVGMVYGSQRKTCQSQFSPSWVLRLELRSVSLPSNAFTCRNMTQSHWEKWKAHEMGCTVRNSQIINEIIVQGKTRKFLRNSYSLPFPQMIADSGKTQSMCLITHTQWPPTLYQTLLLISRACTSLRPSAGL